MKLDYCFTKSGENGKDRVVVHDAYVLFPTLNSSHPSYSGRYTGS